VGTQTFTVLAEELGRTARAVLWPKLTLSGFETARAWLCRRVLKPGQGS
jgi:hypothetical protein